MNWRTKVVEAEYDHVLPLIARFPPRIAHRLAVCRARIRCRARKDTRRKALENLSAVFPELSERDRREIVRRSFELVSRDEMESFWFDRPESFLRRFVERSDLSVLQQARRLGKGVLALTAHAGCPGFFLCYAGRVGFDHWMLLRGLEDIPQQPPAWVRFGYRRVRLLEQAAGHPFLPAGRISYFRLREILRSGGTITTAVDVVPWLMSRTLTVQFLGRECRFPEGLARLYLDCRPAVVFWVCSPEPTGRYYLLVDDLTDLLSPIQDVSSVAARLVGRLERHILERPGDWLQWDALHYFWKGEGGTNPPSHL